MSHASNKVKWCLNKAKKELEESNLHRGLIKTQENIELSQKHITKAKEMHESNVIKLREEFQYNTDLNFKEKEEFNKLIELCKEIINKTREIIQ